MGAYVREDAKAVAQDLARVLAHFPVLGERRRQAATVRGASSRCSPSGAPSWPARA